MSKLVNEGEGQKYPKSCQRSLWTAPNVIFCKANAKRIFYNGRRPKIAIFWQSVRNRNSNLMIVYILISSVNEFPIFLTLNF